MNLFFKSPWFLLLAGAFNCLVAGYFYTIDGGAFDYWIGLFSGAVSVYGGAQILLKSDA